jgi:hypothetical protein
VEDVTMTTRVPADARHRYEADGFYLTPEAILPQDMIARAVAGMDAIRHGEYDRGRPPQPSPWTPGDDENLLCKIEQPQFASQAIYDLFCHPALGETAAALTGAEEFVQVWWVQLLYKPATRPDGEVKTNVGWHQDRYYWQVWEEGSELFTAWIALSDVRPESGPMRFVVGSHRWGLLKDGDFFAQDLTRLKADLALPSGAAWEEATAVLPPGGVSFHDDLTLHGSGPNHGNGPRRSFAVHLRTERSRPVDDKRHGLTTFFDDPALCPVIWERRRGR